MLIIILILLMLLILYGNMAFETEALTAMIYIFIVFAIGLAVFDQYRKLKVSFQKVKKSK